MAKIKQDPDNYLKMSVPHESSDKANEALEAFFDEINKLRKTCKMRDVLVVVSDSVKLSDGTIGDFINCGGFGNSINQLPMAAYAYGKEKKSHDELIAKMLSGKA